MSDHPAIKTVVERIRTDAIGGAADVAKEVIDALSKLVADTSQQNLLIIHTFIPFHVGLSGISSFQALAATTNIYNTYFVLTSWFEIQHPDSGIFEGCENYEWL